MGQLETRATLAVCMAGDIVASGQIGRASGDSLWRPEIDLLRSPRFDGIPHHLELTDLREASGSESGLNSRISNGVRLGRTESGLHLGPASQLSAPGLLRVVEKCGVGIRARAMRCSPACAMGLKRVRFSLKPCILSWWHGVAG